MNQQTNIAASTASDLVQGIALALFGEAGAGINDLITLANRVQVGAGNLGAQSTPSARWAADALPDPHGTRYDCERASLTLGNLTDDALANAVFLHGNEQPTMAQLVAGALPPIAYLTAAKDRIRWLSRALAAATAPQPADERFPGGFTDAIAYVNELEGLAEALHEEVFGHGSDGESGASTVLQMTLHQLNEKPEQVGAVQGDALIDAALGYLSTALDDLDSSPDRRPGIMVTEAMHALREALAARQPSPAGQGAVPCATSASHALRVAYRHLDMVSMRVSHCKDAAIIESAIKDVDTFDLNAAISALAARQPGAQVPVELACVAETLAHGEGLWMTCSGCHESNEGVQTGPYSQIMKCNLGNGCDECGGIGATWDTTDYQQMADAMSKSLAAPTAQGIDLGQLRKLAMPILCGMLCASDAERACRRLHAALIDQRDAAPGVDRG